MGEDGGDVAPVAATAASHGDGHSTAVDATAAHLKGDSRTRSSDDVPSPGLPPGVNPLVRRATSLDLDDYFKGPRDIDRHSKWPLFMRVHGSILPKMIVPLLLVGGWSTCITLISKYVHSRESPPAVQVSYKAI